MGRRASKMLHMIAAGALMLCAADGGLAQNLDENCTVSVLNRTVRVNTDGSWVLPNIPANFGQVKARATCVRNGITTSGESAFFTVPVNGAVNLPSIILGSATQIPASISMTPATPSFTAAGQTTQLLVTATYPDNSTRNVTGASSGTNYTTSNAAIAAVNANGLVTAVASGTVVIQASNDGASGITTATVVLSNVDSDGDGIPDDAEIRLGLDPHNPVDAQEDFDRDGLTNLQEFLLGTNIRNADTDGDGLSDGDEVNQYHTNPLLADTDGDDIPDGVEIQTGSNPLDANSYDLRRAAASSVLTPTSFVLTTSVLFPNASQLLNWKVNLIDGRTTLDLTVDPRTSYSSSDLTVCNFGSEKGRVFAGNPGNCIITISNNTLSVTVPGAVQSFTPSALSFVDIPGFANNVDVNGNFAYVAAGSAGLQVVDVSDHLHPHVVASRSLPGNANDVRVAGNFAYVAAGSGGLQVVNIANPLTPVIAGSLNTGGEAWDVVIKGSQAYVANGANGLVIIDVSTPSSPVRLGSLSLPGTSKGVDVDMIRQIAVVGLGASGLAVVNVASPATPALMSTLTGGDVRDVAISGNFAFLADFSRSFTSVDLTNPASPVLRASTAQNLGGLLQDVVVNGSIAAGADVFFVNGVPMIDVSAPASPQPRLILDFRGFRDDNGTGIAMDSSFVYLTGESGTITENGVNGTTRLYIGQYRNVQDNSGIPPFVQITSPAAGAQVVQGSVLTVTVNATDDVAVAAVNFIVNGQLAFTTSTAPYQFTFTAPVAGSTLTLGATAVDFGGNLGLAPTVTVNLIPDPLTTVTGRVVDANSQPVSGAAVSILGTFTSSTGANGSFTINGVPTVGGNIVVQASGTVGGRNATGQSAAVAPVLGGITPVGDIVIRSLQGSVILIPYLATGYRYLVVGHGQGAGFEQPGFNDGAFSTGDAGFGTSGGGCTLNTPPFVKTDWPTNTDILLRKQFDVAEIPQSITIGVAIDNDVQVFVNGQDVSGGIRIHDGCPSRDSFVFSVPINVLNTGSNLIAVRGVDRGGLAYADIQVTAVYPSQTSISIVPASAFIGPAICKPGFGPPQCTARTFDVGQDLAFQGNGLARSAVAKDVIPGFDAIHRPEFANDGSYGNGSSWISNSTNSWLKIDLGQVTTISRVVFGRDRTGGFDDRDPGRLTISLAPVDTVYANGDDSGDQTEYTQVFDSDDLGFTGLISGSQTVQATFPPTSARFIKVVVANSGAAIDEVQVFGGVMATQRAITRSRSTVLSRDAHSRKSQNHYWRASRRQGRNARPRGSVGNPGTPEQPESRLAVALRKRNR